MVELSIGEVARKAGLATSAIRYYEREGLLPRASRRSGTRVYDPDILDRLTVIGLAKRAGFTVSEIRQLLRGFSGKTAPGVRWRALAKKKLEELERRITEAQQMKDVLKVVTSCECPTFIDCATASRVAR